MHSVVEAAQKSWFSYEPFTLLSTYQTLQKKFINLYSPYENLVKRYRVKTNSQIYPITTEYLNDNPQVIQENVALLKNSMELWRNAAQTTDAVAPILFHYSWHCFNSFFVYTFFRWEPQHSQSHGVCISNMGEDVGKIKITLMKNGLFQRLLDAWSCLGVSLAFSEHLPAFNGDEIGFQSNQIPFPQQSRSLELANLLIFDAHEYERTYWKTFGREKLTQNHSLSNSMGTPSKIMRSYLILFAASSVARYRPVLWSSILSGETEDKSAFALAYRDALLTYSQFGINSISFLNEFSKLLYDLLKGEFEIKHLPQ
jgi:hypothetical protein